MERKAVKGYAWHRIESIGSAATKHIRKRSDQPTVSTFQYVFFRQRRVRVCDACIALQLRRAQIT
jgi:hypothetical protein